MNREPFSGINVDPARLAQLRTEAKEHPHGYVNREPIIVSPGDFAKFLAAGYIDANGVLLGGAKKPKPKPRPKPRPY